MKRVSSLQKEMNQDYKMIVTEKEYYMEKKLIQILDMMIDRMTGNRKMDNLLIIDGDEGYGKSTFSAQIGNYVAEKSGRKFSVKNFFFDVDKMTEHAIKTSDQVIIWDEAALAGLASEWQKKEQIKLIKLLMVARKKRHFWIFNIPKFFKMNEYIVVDRAIGLVHVYARNEKQLGRFVYFKKNRKAQLYDKWKKSHVRAYNKFRSFRGTFPSKFDGIIDEQTYDKMKDEAIMSIHKVKVDKSKEKEWMWKKKIVDYAETNGLKGKEAYESFGIPKQSWYDLLSHFNKGGVLSGTGTGVRL